MSTWATTTLVVGIDFGTTYSGVTWTTSESKHQIRVITDWPNPLAGNANAEKVPSLISYQNGEVKNWGYEVGLKEESLKWIKVLLESHPKKPQTTNEVKESNMLLAKLGKTPEDVVADYLQCLWNYAKEDIRKRVDDESWETSYEVRIVVTVPAVWSDSAKAKTLSAAQRAGMGSNITMITEPEAAALATLKGKAESHALENGDAFVVCDAGGGTVDLISYRIVGVEPLEVEECAVGDGDLCGSLYLDLAFERYIKTLVSETKYVGLTATNRKKMMRDFESGVKRAYAGDPKKEYTVDLKGVEDDETNGISDDTICLKPSALRTVFDHVCGQIETLVQRQVTSVTEKGLVAKAILLVGGFGESKYLHKRLEQTYKAQGIRVMQVNGAWSSICRGATMWGLTLRPLTPKAAADDSKQGDSRRPTAETGTIKPPPYSPMIKSRLCRGNYGFLVHTPWIPGVHLPQDHFIDPLSGKSRAARQMTWLLTRGDEITGSGRIIDYEVYRDITGIKWSSGSTVRDFETALYYSPAEKPPMRMEKGVQMLCKVKYRMSESQIRRETKAIKSQVTKEKYRQLGFVLKLTVNAAGLDFQVFHEGVSLASVETSYVDI